MKTESKYWRSAVLTLACVGCGAKPDQAASLFPEPSDLP